ncbi:uncharacterized protein LOC132571976 [Heteronotia binoei]|uniref:uncharacterized protein LOC132571976 n=1 Tax=Heteronotia binoei TaxID=13085 RepID=UPI00292EC9C6|nr:uncharacterized protein LOC132571976 [Heteronotia binoei]
MPARKQGLPERKACCGKEKKVTDVTKGRTMVTRSMQREKAKGQNLCDTVKSLPNLSGILIQAINLCKSAKGLSFTELKELLGAKGYDVSRYCPSIKKQLKSLASKGALMRMSHKAGSTFFVIRKHQRKEVATQASEKMTVRYLRSTTANAAKKSGSATSRAGSKRSGDSSNGVRVSKKGLGGTYSHTAPNLKISKYSRSKNSIRM